MALKQVLALLVDLEAAGTVDTTAQHVSLLDDAGTVEIVLTLRSSDPAVRGQFLDAVTDERAPKAAKKPAKKAAKKAK